MSVFPVFLPYSRYLMPKLLYNEIEILKRLSCTCRPRKRNRVYSGAFSTPSHRKDTVSCLQRNCINYFSLAFGYRKKITKWFWCLNATFNNISAISWRPVLVVEEAGVPEENYQKGTKQRCVHTSPLLFIDDVCL
jgi:hypothetical protein